MQIEFENLCQAAPETGSRHNFPSGLRHCTLRVPALQKTLNIWDLQAILVCIIYYI